jgi:hypothetical protein
MMWTLWDGWNYGALALILGGTTVVVAGIGDVWELILYLPFVLLGIALVVGVGRIASIGFIKGALIGSGTTVGLYAFLALDDAIGGIAPAASIGLLSGIAYGAVLSAAKGYRLGWIVLVMTVAYVFVLLCCAIR